jgi:hypothetical protein
MQDRQQWLEERRQGIGGSDWGDILGIEPYGCERRAWLDKRGVEPDVDIKTGAMDRGMLLEQVIADTVANEHGYQIRRPGRLARPKELPFWWIGNIDREIIGHERGPGVLELKTKGPIPFRALKRNGLDQSELAQCQHYLGLTGRSWAHYHAREVVSWAPLDLIFEPLPDLLEQMVRAGERFWSEVKNPASEGPAKLAAKDPRCHRCPFPYVCQGAEVLYTEADKMPGEPIDMSDDYELVRLLDDYDDVKEMADEAVNLFESIKGKIWDHLADHGGFEPGMRWRVFKRPIACIQASGNRFDTAAFKKAHPDLAEEYTKPYVNKPFGRVF